MRRASPYFFLKKDKTMQARISFTIPESHPMWTDVPEGKERIHFNHRTMTRYMRDHLEAVGFPAVSVTKSSHRAEVFTFEVCEPGRPASDMTEVLEQGVVPVIAFEVVEDSELLSQPDDESDDEDGDEAVDGDEEE
jgi:hypothetical protein